ncbi:hypothetical protein TNCV_3116861 [Trichonephila clavipes]|nr:hypothetical protein TNCV_3116861 [Trichonephila clavipes]
MATNRLGTTGLQKELEFYSGRIETYRMRFIVLLHCCSHWSDSKDYHANIESMDSEMSPLSDRTAPSWTLKHEAYFLAT